MPTSTFCFLFQPISIRINHCARRFFLIVHFIFCFTCLSAGDIETGLVKLVEQAPNDSLKIVALGNLAHHYFQNYEIEKGDSVASRQLFIAEASRNQNLVLWVLFGTQENSMSDIKIHSQYQKERFQHALDFAKYRGLNDYAALAYCKLSAYELDEGNIEKALSLANLAITTSFASANDSVKVLCTLQMGQTYLAQGNSLMAFKAFNNGYDLAVQNKNRILISEVYRAIASIYKRLEQTHTAIEYIFRSIEINEQENRRDRLVADYISLGKLYSYDIAQDYLLKGETLADSLNNKSLKVEAQKILFSYTMTKAPPAVTLQFLQRHDELLKLFEHMGPGYLDWMYGEVYLYAGFPDSASHFFEKAAPYFDNGYSISQRKDFYFEMANSYYESKNIDIGKTIGYKEKSLALCQQVSDLRKIQMVSHDLSDLYQRKLNYKTALFYNIQYDHYKDSLALLSKEKDLALLEISNETKRKAEEQALIEEKTRREHNLQYMAITITVVTAFVLLLFLGIFKVSKLTIRLLGFLSFISFFEFIIMLLDKYIHHITHGEPLKIWLIKIGLLSMLMPMHHWLEEKVIHYLLSRHLIEYKSFSNLRRLLSRRKKLPVAEIVTENILQKEDGGAA